MNTMRTRQGITALLVVFCIALVAVLGGLAVYKMRKTAPATSMAPDVTPTSVMNATGTPQVSPTQAAMAATTGNTDADLQTDSADVSTKLNALNNDSASIDQGLNDKPGNLSEN